MTNAALGIILLMIMVQLISVGWHFKSEDKGAGGYMIQALIMIVLLIAVMGTSVRAQ